MTACDLTQRQGTIAIEELADAWAQNLDEARTRAMASLITGLGRSGGKHAKLVRPHPAAVGLPCPLWSSLISFPPPPPTRQLLLCASLASRTLV